MKVKREINNKNEIVKAKIKSINGVDWNLHNEIDTFDWLEKEAKRIIDESEDFKNNELAQTELEIELRNMNDSYNRLKKLGMKEDELNKITQRYFEVCSNLERPMAHKDLPSYRSVYMANIRQLKDCIKRHYRLLDRIDEQMNIKLGGHNSYVESCDITPPSVLNKNTMENINYYLNEVDLLTQIDSLLETAKTKEKWKNFR